MAKKSVSGCFALIGFFVAVALFVTGCQGLGKSGSKGASERYAVAVSTDEGVFLSWRLYLNDPANIAFNVYRDKTKINNAPLGPANTDFLDRAGTINNRYQIEVLHGKTSRGFSENIIPLNNNYISIPLQKPAFNLLADGNPYVDAAYNAYDCVPCDLDGDGIMDFVIFWSPANEKDSSQSGITGIVYIDAYSLNGRKFWGDNKYIELGPNIRAGNHDQVMAAADFNGDGYGEIMVKTAPLTVDTQGKVIGPVNASGNIIYWNKGADGIIRDSSGSEVDTAPFHYVNESGFIVSGEEYLSIFDGRTGTLIDTIEFPVQRNQMQYARDTFRFYVQGNRTHRFNAGAAKLSHAKSGAGTLSGVFGRGYYSEQALTFSAVDFDGAKLEVRWISSTDPYTAGTPVRPYPQAFETHLIGATGTIDYTDAHGPYGDPSGQSFAGPYPDKAVYGTEGAGALYRGQGNHQIAIADADKDGLDEIYLGSMTIGHDGKIRWSTGRGHGDAMHIGNHNPWVADGDLLVLCVLEGTTGMQMLNARTGETIWYHPGTGDTGRGMASDIDIDYPGNEAWAAANTGLRSTNAEGTRLADPFISRNFGIFWGGGTSRFLLDGGNEDGDEKDAYILQMIKAGEGEYIAEKVITFAGMRSNAGTKQVPMLQADLFGDFREEVIYRDLTSSELRVFTTTIPTIHEGPWAIPAGGIPTLQDSHQYWMQVLCQHSSYNQPPWPQWFIGHGMEGIR